MRIEETNQILKDTKALRTEPPRAEKGFAWLWKTLRERGARLPSVVKRRDVRIGLGAVSAAVAAGAAGLLVHRKRSRKRSLLRW